MFFLVQRQRLKLKQIFRWKKFSQFGIWIMLWVFRLRVFACCTSLYAFSGVSKRHWVPVVFLAPKNSCGAKNKRRIGRNGNSTDWIMWCLHVKHLGMDVKCSSCLMCWFASRKFYFTIVSLCIRFAENGGSSKWCFWRRCTFCKSCPLQSLCFVTKLKASTSSVWLHVHLLWIAACFSSFFLSLLSYSKRILFRQTTIHWVIVPQSISKAFSWFSFSHHPRLNKLFIALWFLGRKGIFLHNVPKKKCWEKGNIKGHRTSKKIIGYFLGCS